MMNVMTMVLGTVVKGVTIPLLLLLLIPALIVVAAGVVVVAVMVLRIVHRAIFSHDEVAIGLVERLLKAGSAAIAEVLEARQRRRASRSEVKGTPLAEG
jgi:hypothetical protein